MRLTDKEIAAIRDARDGILSGDWSGIIALLRALATEVLESRAALAAKDARISDFVLMLDRQFGTPCEQIRHRQEVAELTRERDEARAANERDRTHIIMAINKLVDAQRSYSWLLDGGRGSYVWDDDRYRDEFGHAMKAMDGPIEALRKIGKDRTECPETQAGVEAARAAVGRDKP